MKRDRADPPARHRAHPHADAAARRSARSPITSTSISTSRRRCGRNSAWPAASACISPVTGRTCSSICGRSWKTADEREGRSVRLGGKTVIIPNPGGAPRRDPIEPPAAAFAAAGTAASAAAARCSTVAAAVRRMPCSRRSEDWVSTRAPGKPAAGAGAGPSPKRAGAAARAAHSARSRAQCVATRRNSRPRTRSPQAAAPLLILLGRLRLHIVDMQAVPLMNHVAQAITEFEKKIVATGVHAARGAGRQIRACAARPTTSSRTCRAPTGMSGCSTACWRSSSRCARPASASSRS